MMQIKNTFVLSLFFLATFIGNAQENIQINTNTTQLVLRVNQNKQLDFEYYGEKLSDLKNLFDAGANAHADAYPAFGLRPNRLMAIRAKHADGNLTLVLKYQSKEKEKISKDVELTTIHLKDGNYPFYVDLKYKVFKAENVIEAWTEIWHKEKKSVTLYNYASASLSFNAPKAYITHFHGNWADEFMTEETQLKDGTFSVENTAGDRNSESDNASFFLSLNHTPSENTGEVVAGTLAWTGNYKITFKRDKISRIHLTAGINNYASDYTLDKGKKFTTPALILTYSNKGKGQASRNLHRYARKYKMVGGDKERKILLNSWEGVHMNFDENKIVDLIDDAANIGVELFVLDDGWFGNKYPRNSDKQGLGDWQTNKKKLPHGLKYLIDEAEKKGIDFGIWVEPEMTNTISELYDTHPDWVLQNKNRKLVKGRGGTQVVLDLSNPKVQDFVFNTVNNLLVKHPRIDYVKWDANTDILNYGSPYLPKNKQSNLYVDYHLGLQKVLKRLRKKHPSITMQACASGGGRVNYGYLKYFNEFWPSDNTDAVQRIYTQWGMSQLFPAITMAAHVSSSPNHHSKRPTPIKFRFDVAMTGRLGIEMQPKDMTEKERGFSKSAIKTYEKIRPIVQFGDLYRILSPFKNRFSSLLYIDQQKQNAVYFAYELKEKFGKENPLFKLEGLDPDKSYQVVEINKYFGKTHFNGEGKVYAGSFLMGIGLKLNLRNQYDSVVLQLSAVND